LSQNRSKSLPVIGDKIYYSTIGGENEYIIKLIKKTNQKHVAGEGYLVTVAWAEDPSLSAELFVQNLDAFFETHGFYKKDDSEFCLIEQERGA